MAEDDMIDVGEDVAAAGARALAAKEVGFEGTGVLVRAEMDAALVAAKNYRRQIKAAVKQLNDLVLLDPDTAEECIYALKRRDADGKEKIIDGPSIRFAEIASSCWGNIRTASRIVAEGREFVTAQGVCVDLETNNHASIEIHRRIVGKKGNRFGVDMIAVTMNAAASIARRNAILSVVPKPFWRGGFFAARGVVTGNIQTLAQRKDRAFKVFSGWGIEPRHLAAWLGKPSADDINMEDMVGLTGLANSIREGEITVESVIRNADEEAGPAAAGGFNPLGRRGQEGGPKDGEEDNREPVAPKDMGGPPAETGGPPPAEAKAPDGGKAPATRKARAPRGAAAQAEPAGNTADPGPGGGPGGNDARGAVSAAAGTQNAADSPKPAGQAPEAAPAAADAPAPVGDILEQLKADVAAAKDAAALEEVAGVFVPLLQGRMSAEEDAFVDKLITDRFQELTREEAARAAAAAEEKRRAEEEAQKKAAAPPPAKETPPAPAAPAVDIMERFKQFIPKDPSRVEEWKKAVTLLVAAKDKEEVSEIEAANKAFFEPLPHDFNIPAIRFKIRQSLSARG